MILRITSFEHRELYKLRIAFNNGAIGIIDLEPELTGEIFEPLRDRAFFQQAFLTNRTIEWPNGADFAPEFLYEIAELTVKPSSTDYSRLAA